MIRKTALISIFLLVAFLRIYGQVDTIKESSAISEILEGNVTKHNLESPQSESEQGYLLKSNDFNTGIVSDPFLLLQGKVPGLQVYNRGGDPNVSSIARIRGLTTVLGQSRPLIVIDGIPNANIEQIDPKDIDQITMLKDGSEAATYGIRANQGVILITTKSAKNSDGKIKVTYSGDIGISNRVEGINTLNPKEYVALENGLDEGFSTEWIDVIHRIAPSYTSHMAVSGNVGPIDYRVSGNYRKINGVLINSDFTKLNTKINLNGNFLNDKLKIRLNGGYTNLEQNISYQEAVQYANYFNPTVPIYGVDALRPFNSDLYGGYYQALNIFEGRNPLSVVEQNQNIGNQSIANFSGLIAFDLSSKTTASLRLAHQSVESYQREYNPTTSYFRGYSRFEWNKGRGLFSTENQSFNFADAFITQEISSESLTMKFTGGFSAQSDEQGRSLVLTRGYPDDEIDLRNASSINQKIDAANEVEQSNFSIPIENTSAFYVGIDTKFKDNYFLNAIIRNEGSNLLSMNNNRATFFGVQAGVELKDILNISAGNSIRPKIGISRTGGIPLVRGLSRDYVVNYTDINGNTESRIERAGNNSLKWEAKDELNIGAEFSSQNLKLGLDWYKRNTKDIITSHSVDPTVFGSSTQYDNLMGVSSTGFEFYGLINVIEKNNFSYQTNLIAATFNTIVTDFRAPINFAGSFAWPGFGSTLAIRLEEGSALGDIYGPVMIGVDAEGEPIYEDINNDGQVITSGSQGDETTDFTVLGNAFPKMELGWNHSLKIGTIELNIFLRSAIGHSMINSARVFHEPTYLNPSFYNFVRTELYNPDLRFPRYNSAFVENASFVKLDNLRLTKRFKFEKDNFVSKLSISLVGQNLLSFTNYTGTDPEPVIIDPHTSKFNLGENSILYPGFDRRKQYYPARTYSLNINLEF